ncbi:hypothetical protein [Vibrio astriarenae]|uniref:hypothetical protein n=1 Tax=Vibrio astriarenae TaxID=1481923 RepID=UPI003734D5EF
MAFGIELRNPEGKPLILDGEEHYTFVLKDTLPATGEGTGGRINVSSEVMNINHDVTRPPLIFIKNSDSADITTCFARPVFWENEWRCNYGSLDSEVDIYVFQVVDMVESQDYGFSIYNSEGGLAYHSAYKLLQIEDYFHVDQTIQAGDPEDDPASGGEDRYIASIGGLTAPAMGSPFHTTRDYFVSFTSHTPCYAPEFIASTGVFTRRWYTKVILGIDPDDFPWPNNIRTPQHIAVIDASRYD